MNIDYFSRYENKELVTYANIDQLKSRLIPYDSLKDRNVDGVLTMNIRLEDNKLYQLYSNGDKHALIVASTGLGKSQSVVIPQIFSFASQKSKRSMIISDAKGEIYRYTAAKLKEEGYKIICINARDVEHSETINILSDIYDTYHELDKILDDIVSINDNGVIKCQYHDTIFENQTQLEEFFSKCQKRINNKTFCLVDNIVNTLLNDIEGSKDPAWGFGAKNIFKAIIWAMLEDSNLDDDDPKKITKDTFSIRTICEILNNFIGSADRGQSTEEFDKGFFSSRSQNSIAKNLINGELNTAPATRTGYFSTLNSSMTFCKSDVVQSLTCATSFDVNELINNRIALFIDYPDESDTYYQLISIFVQYIYNHLLNYLSSIDKPSLDVPLYFILDEFGNFPEIPSFACTISACRSRNIYFILVLQSYAQLERVYNNKEKNVAQIIIDNINLHIFLGSNNYETLNKFQKECGQYTCFKIGKYIKDFQGSSAVDDLETLPLLTISKLSSLNPCECVIVESNCPYVLFSYLERAYMSKEITKYESTNYKDYKPNIDFYENRYYYTFVNKEEKQDEFKFPRW